LFAGRLVLPPVLPEFASGWFPWSQRLDDFLTVFERGNFSLLKFCTKNAQWCTFDHMVGSVKICDKISTKRVIGAKMGKSPNEQEQWRARQESVRRPLKRQGLWKEYCAGCTA
jgi:hypothetical protein